MGYAAALNIPKEGGCNVELSGGLGAAGPRNNHACGAAGRLRRPAAPQKECARDAVPRAPNVVTALHPQIACLTIVLAFYILIVAALPDTIRKRDWSIVATPAQINTTS